MSNKNPESSTLIQGLLELAKHDDIDDETRDTVRKLCTLLDDRLHIVKEVDKTVRLKEYADKSVTFDRIPKYNLSGGIYDILSTAEITLLHYLISAMSQHNRVQICTDDIIATTQMSLRTVRSSIKKLINTGFLVVDKPAITRKHIPAVYIINPDIAMCGKKNDILIQQIFYKKSKISRKKFKDSIQPNGVTQSIITVDKLRIGTIDNIKKDDYANTK